MSRRFFRHASRLAAFLVLAGASHAQPAPPHIGYVYPAGGKQGTKFRVTVGGQFLDGVTSALTSGQGVAARVVGYFKPLTPQQANALRERLQELQKAKRDPSIVREIAEIRAKLAGFVRRPPNPGIAELATFEITLDPGANPGQRDLRLRTPAGISNPVFFQIGQLTELREKERPTNQLALRANRVGDAPRPAISAPPLSVVLPVCVNGQILPGEVDRYRFQARSGQHLVLAVSARELIPYLADAVPGWFQPTLALFDSRGNELAFDDDFRFHPDPVLHYQVPKDGDYIVEIKDAIYRGREDFVYRINMGELPFITSIYPLGGQVGASSSLELRGWNLPLARMPAPTGNGTAGVYPVTIPDLKLPANPPPFALDTLPECQDQEPNDDPAKAQTLALPVIVNGRIDRPGDRDVFALEGHGGQEIVAEVTARRLDSPLDSVLSLTDANGRQLAFNDDHEDRAAGLNTHHADSWLRLRFPADGRYYLQLRDAQQQGGAEYAYRLRVSAPRPRFELRVAPSSINVRAGMSAVLTVYALRKDGFTNEIAVSLKDSPAGFSLNGGLVPANADQVRLTLTARAMPLQEPAAIALQGTALIDGQQVTIAAVPAEDMMQAFAYRHLVPAHELRLDLVGRAMPRGPVRLLTPGTVTIQPGGETSVLLGLPPRFAENMELELSEPPDGLTLQKVDVLADRTRLVLHADAAKVKPGLKGNLLVQAFAVRPGGPKQAKAMARRRNPLGTLPAIPFEIIAP